MRRASITTSRAGNRDSSNNANWLAALNSADAITGTSPDAIPSMTLNDSMSTIDGCTNRSHERSSAGISAFLWNPICALRSRSR